VNPRIMPEMMDLYFDESIDAEALDLSCREN